MFVRPNCECLINLLVTQDGFGTVAHLQEEFLCESSL
jgi:hypothetical protein